MRGQGWSNQGWSKLPALSAFGRAAHAVKRSPRGKRLMGLWQSMSYRVQGMFGIRPMSGDDGRLVAPEVLDYFYDAEQPVTPPPPSAPPVQGPSKAP